MEPLLGPHPFGVTGLLIEKYIRLVTSEHGENYWFNGCAAYVMECLGEKTLIISFSQGLPAMCLSSITGSRLWATA